MKYLIDINDLREALKGAALSNGMANRIAKAYRVSVSTARYCVKKQGTTIGKLVLEEKERRARKWVENRGTLDQIHVDLGYVRRKDAAELVKTVTGHTPLGWYRIWENEEKRNG